MTEHQRTAAPRDPRREDRTAWQVHHAPELALRVAGLGDLPVAQLRNVSSSGASVVVSRALAVDTMASIVVNAADARLEFIAQVAWCRAVADNERLAEGPSVAGHHALGLRLRGPGSFAAMLGVHASATD